jgi:hypothetical protein
MIIINSWHYFLILLFPPSDVCFRRHCIFLLFHSCSVCSAYLSTTIFKYKSYVVPDTFWHVIPFHITTFFLDMIWYFLVRNTCVSIESHAINQWTHMSVSHLGTLGTSWQLSASDRQTYFCLSCLLTYCSQSRTAWITPWTYWKLKMD